MCFEFPFVIVQISWSFHRNHGINVVLSNNEHTAELQGDLCGIVMSGEPLKINTLYEVEFMK